MIECKDLTKKYKTGEREFYALKSVSCTIRKGEYVVVFGKSGSGKSTLMNMIGLTDVPTSGEIRVFGKEISELSEGKKAYLRNQKIGYVFQNFYLEPSYTVYMNIEVPLLIAGVSRKERRNRIEKALEEVGMTDRIHNRASELSGGERQRVSIARALINDPELILADEPCGNLDSGNTEIVMSIFDQLHKAGKTVVLITHSEDEADHAERMIHLKDGQVIHHEQNADN